MLLTLGKLAVYCLQNVLPYLLSQSSHAVSRKSHRAAPVKKQTGSGDFELLITSRHTTSVCSLFNMSDQPCIAVTTVALLQESTGSDLLTGDAGAGSCKQSRLHVLYYD
jgi:hypothetical protein